MLIEGFEKEGVIKVDNVRVYGLEESIKASKYPMSVDTVDMDKHLCCNGSYEYFITDKDIERAIKLGNAKAGSGHDCMQKGITVQFDLQVSEYIWRQLDRYHFIDYVSSQSKMHRILKLDIDKACNKYVTEETVNQLMDLVDCYNRFEEYVNDDLFDEDIRLRNEELIDMNKENIFKLIIANTPSGIMLTARMTTNYLQLKSMYNQRHNHKMEEWRLFTEWFKTLPMLEELVLSRK